MLSVCISLVPLFSHLLSVSISCFFFKKKHNPILGLGAFGELNWVSFAVYTTLWRSLCATRDVKPASSPWEGVQFAHTAVSPESDSRKLLLPDQQTTERHPVSGQETRNHSSPSHRDILASIASFSNKKQYFALTGKPVGASHSATRLAVRSERSQSQREAAELNLQNRLHPPLSASPKVPQRALRLGKGTHLTPTDPAGRSLQFALRDEGVPQIGFLSATG